MKRITQTALLCIFVLLGLISTTTCMNAQSSDNTIYKFKVEGLNGDTIDFAKFKGKKILIVNTASKCGFTPQYEALETLAQKYKDKLVIVGFPANDFGQQEPGSNGEIATFCQQNYGLTFPMAAKISVIQPNQAPIYQWLTEKAKNGVESSTVQWNFQKYLIDENGHYITHFMSKVTPLSPEILNYLK